MADEEDPLSIGNRQLLNDQFARENVSIAVNLIAEPPGFSIPTKAISSDLQ
ncbi:hypothetical protein SDC9_189369 [bioreactor metagenome]|uniref:Uncharacterized protein n=1 Tax=bioreactor metagenome TaxID=1076179 RepID=A0A645I068_9ZZZZ